MTFRINPPIGSKFCAWALAALALCITATVHAQPQSRWSSTNTQGLWSVGGWSGSALTNGSTILFTNNDVLTTTNDANASWRYTGLYMRSNATADRTIIGNVNLFGEWGGSNSKVEVNSGTNHRNLTISGDVSVGGNTNLRYEFNPVGGSIIIGGSITDFGSGRVIHMFGNNSENDLVRSVVVSNGITGGNGLLVLRQYANLVLMGSSTYTNNTEIDTGTLMLGQGTLDGTLSGSSRIYVGNSTVGGNATLRLGKEDGGQVLDGAAVLQINANTSGGRRTIQSDNTSGTNTIARTITNNAQLFITNAAGGVLRFEGGFTSSANSIVVQGGGTNAVVEFAAANSFSNVFVDYGHVRFDADNSWGTGSIALGRNATEPNGAVVSFTTNFTMGAAIEARTNAGDKTIMYTGDGGILTLAGNLTNNATGTARGLGLDVASGGTMRISGQISGGGNITTVNDGTVVLDNAASSFGALQISNGTVVASNSFTAAGLSGAGTLDIANGTATINSSADHVFDGEITGSGGFAKAGSGRLTLENANSSFTGDTDISGGQLLIGHEEALGSGGDVAIGSGGALLLSNNISVSRPITSLGGNTGEAFGALQSASGINEWTGLISLGADAGVSALAGSTLILNDIAAGDNALWVAGDGDTIMDGTITSDRVEATSFVKTNTGTVYVMGDNALEGNRFIREGTVVLGHNNAFGSSGVTTVGGLNSASSTNAAVLAVGQGVTHSGEIRIQPTTTNNALRVLAYNEGEGTGTLAGNIVLSNNVTVDVADGGALHSSGDLSGPGIPVITKTGGGTFIASGAAGDNKVQLADGTVVVASNGALSTGTSTAARAVDLGFDGTSATANNVALYASNGVTVSNSIYVAANVDSATRALGTTDAGATVIFDNEIYLDGNARLTAGAGSEAIFSGDLINAGGIQKDGAGTVTLSGDNAFSGSTTVSEGTLALNTLSGSALGGTDSVNVNAGAVLLIANSDQVSDDASVTLSGGAILRSGGVNEVFGDLSLTAASFIDFGSGDVGELRFGTYSNTVGEDSFLLTVSSFAVGNTLVFGTDLSSSIMDTDLFVFSNQFNYSWNIDTSTFTITAIPETSTSVAVAVVTFVLALTSVNQFRRRRGMTPRLRS